MATPPALPAEKEDPWWTKRRAWDLWAQGEIQALQSVTAGGVPLGARMRPVRAVHPTATITHTDDLGPAFPSPVGVLWSDPRIGYLHATPTEVGPSYGATLKPTGGDNPQSIYGTVLHDCEDFALHLTNWATDTGTDVTVIVDGMIVGSFDPYIVTGAGYQYVHVAGLEPGVHEIVFIIGWGANFLQFVSQGGLVAAGQKPRFTLGIWGDSYTDSGIAPHFAGLARELFLLTGWAIAQLGQGSTGYTNDGASSGDASKSIYGSTSRLAAISAADPDLLLAVGSVNDGGASAAAVKSAAKSAYAAVSRPVVVLGVEPLYNAGDPSYAAWDTINTAVLEAAAESPNVIDIIDWRGEDWLTGTGCVSGPAFDGGNQDLLIGDPAGLDIVHPNLAGQRYLAGRIVERLAPIRL